MAGATSTTQLSHNNIQPLAIALILIFPILATISLALRLYSRTLTRTFASDDVVIICAGILYWAFTFASYKVIKIMYTGYHMWDIPPDFDIVSGLKYGYASELLYNPILALVKTSILLFLLRLTGQKTAVRNSIIGLLIFNFAMMITTFFLTVFHCVPIQANWYPASYPNAKCMNFADFVTGTACVSVFTDILSLMLPTWIVYDLKISKKQKLMLIGILSFGLVTVITGIVRVVLLDNYDRHPPADFNYSILFCLSTFEVGLSFIAACAPALKPIISKVMPKIFSTGRTSAGRYGRTGRPSRMGYQLEQSDRMPTKRMESNRTQIDSEGIGMEDFRYVKGAKDGIVLTTKTEVKWHNSTEGISEREKSTESLV